MPSSSAKKSSNNKPFSKTNDNIDDVGITRDEFSQFKEAFKKDEFKKLFFDYCEEVQDPANRKLFQEEITQLEAERGVDVTFVNPEPGFVIETSVDGSIKCFVNIAKSSVVDKPSNKAVRNAETGNRGLLWSIPMSQSAPRDDFDNVDKISCRIFDVIFHPDALYLSEKNSAFRKCLIDTACDGIEQEFGVHLDRLNLKYPDIKFKGLVHSTVIRKLSDNPPPDTGEPDPLASIYPEKPKPTKNKNRTKKVHSTTESQQKYTTPKYVIKHRRDIDLSEMTNELDAKLNVTLPRELIVEIDLPLIKSTINCQLDVTNDSVYFFSDNVGAKYKLKIDLPYRVNDKNGTANFDVCTRRLIITLPVVRDKKERLMRDLYREDSGVESDIRDDIHSNSESPVEELNSKLEDESNYPEANSTTIKSIAPATETKSTFLKNTIEYTFPRKFNCNILDNAVSFVLHVRNIQHESIVLQKNSNSLHIQFVSIGSGFYPIYFAFYFQLPAHHIDTIDSAEAEAWENNLILNIKLTANSNLQSYFAGLDESDIKEYTIQDKFVTQKPKNLLVSNELQSQPPLEVSVERLENEKTIEIQIKPRELVHYDDEEPSLIPINSSATNLTNKKQKKKNKKRRSLSESACDNIHISYHKNHQEKHHTHPVNKCILHHEEDSNSSIEHENDVHPKKEIINSNKNRNKKANEIPIPSNPQRKQRSYSECRDNSSAPSYKGILKHYSRYDRNSLQISDSFSSNDDQFCMSHSCSIDGAANGGLISFSDIPEERDIRNDVEGGDYLSESLRKKTVRFNEVIKKQVFRLDSSILGQRKRNQKRKNQKQRAIHRRLSEGDCADYEDNKPISPKDYGRYYKTKGHRHNSKHIARHDSGVDLSVGIEACKISCEEKIDSEVFSDADSKNSMMFEMDM